MRNMKDTYGSTEKAKEVFYASRNAGKIKGVDPESGGKADKKEKSAAYLKGFEDTLKQAFETSPELVDIWHNFTNGQ